jgi:hypothetical protein
MNSLEIRIRQKLKDDFYHFSSKCLKIRTKAGKVLPFEMNKAQRYIHEKLEEQRQKTGKIRAIILKGRQQGASTYIEGRFYWKVSHRKGVRAFILTHEADATSNLFEMAERYHENCPALVKPITGASNAKELDFNKLDSGYKVGTAGNKGVGRSNTIQYFHGSEVAFWPHASEHAKGILQAIPDEDDTEILLESTANGIGNYYHQQWQQAEVGESEFIAIFVPWFWQDEYRKLVPKDFSATEEENKLKEIYQLDNGQLMFRRFKIVELSADGVDGSNSFKQEYPMTATEAFLVSGGDTLIQPTIVTKARKTKCFGSGPLIIGVDPARFGDDKTAIIRRRNRAAYGLKTYAKRSTMEIAGIVNTIIKEEKPAQVAIDVGGLGAGVVDRLIELGHEDIVVPINFGSSALDPERYINRRAEMWWKMNEWLLGDMPVMIPDLDSLHSDLCAPRYSYDSNTRRQLESKQKMRARGVRSPDSGDALALTLAEPVIIIEEDESIVSVVGDPRAGY